MSDDRHRREVSREVSELTRQFRGLVSQVCVLSQEIDLRVEELTDFNGRQRAAVQALLAEDGRD